MTLYIECHIDCYMYACHNNMSQQHVTTTTYIYVCHNNTSDALQSLGSTHGRTWYADYTTRTWHHMHVTSHARYIYVCHCNTSDALRSLGNTHARYITCTLHTCTLQQHIRRTAVSILHRWTVYDTHVGHMCVTATHCNTLQHTATHCKTLQHTATHCKTAVCYIDGRWMTCMLHTCTSQQHNKTAAEKRAAGKKPKWFKMN